MEAFSFYLGDLSEEWEALRSWVSSTIWSKFQMVPNTGVMFDDMAGVDDAKQDFMEVVEFLKKPERFTATGACIPKGVFLMGP